MKRAAGCLMAAVLSVATGLAWPELKASAEDAPAAATAGNHFEREVAPLLARRCLGCHNPEEHKGGLDLSSQATAMAGGESGVVLAPRDLEASDLWQRVDSAEMPPKKPLSAAEKSVLRKWIADGAAWGSGPIDRFRFTSDVRAGYDWWSLAPLRQVAVPKPVADAGWVRNPIDAFVLARLQERSLTPSPEPDRRTLLRRLSVDLLGLPPTPEEVAEFVADTDPQAYEKLVDRMLASPHYGEHWARHWLDVARFGESDGFEYDVLRPRAWLYRDWVISALNRDLPYDEFARLQIAGDVLHPADPDAVTATGFLVAGARDNLVPAGEPMRLIMREDEMEDMVGTVAQSFLGLTVNCARCHDHKFDPIRHSEYYRLSSALAGVKHGERELPMPGPANLAQLQQELTAARAAISAIDEPARLAILAERATAARTHSPPQPIARWNFAKGVQDELGGLEVSLRGSARVDGDGLHLDGKTAYALSPPLERQLQSKTLEAWVSLANVTQRGGAALSVQTLDGNQFDAIVFGETEPSRWIAGSDGFRRTQRVDGPEEPATADEFVHVAIVYHDDGTIVVYRNGQPYGSSYQSSGPLVFAAGSSQAVFGLRQGPPGEGKLLAGVVRRAQLYDRALSAAEVAESAGANFQGVSQSQILARLSPEQSARRTQLLADIASLDDRIHPRPPRVFAVKAQIPLVLHRLDRGNPQAPREVVSPGGVKAVSGPSADFGLPADASDDERRKALAQWITSQDNPLFARVMANRVWHYHFGSGIVETPNDLGFNGGRPSHGELLDWLAGEFIRQGYNLKRLHRTIVTSAVYRQSSKPNRAALAIDAGNRLLWRYPPRRLDAETVRDAVLMVSGQLTERGGGAGFSDFNVFNDRGTQRYEPLDPEGPQFNRRSIYRTWARGGRNPLLDTFDCPDPSITSPQRGVTTTPLQALVLLNNSFLLRMSDHFGARVAADAGSKTGDQVRRAYELAYGRAPTAAETARVEPFVEKHGLAALCRVLLNSNEFLYCD